MARRGGGVATALMIALSLCVFAGGAYALYYVLTAVPSSSGILFCLR